MSTIVHEIGHALHLDHPLGSGYTASFDESISVMSYNQDPRYGGDSPVWFRDLDIHTLQSIWGKETNSEPAQWPATESFPAVVDHLPYTDRAVDPLLIEASDSTFTLDTSQEEDATTSDDLLEEHSSTPEISLDDHSSDADASLEDHSSTLEILETEVLTIIDDANTLLQSNADIEDSTDDFKSIKGKKVDKLTEKISKKIQSKWEAKQIAKRIGGDSEMDVYIHTDGGKIGNKKVRKVGKAVPASQVEVNFMVDVLNDIDKISGLDFNLVGSSSEADIVIAPMNMRKWEYWFDEPRKKKDPWTYAWLSDGEDGMTISEKNFCTQVMLGAIGLRELSDKDRKKFTSFHTIMSWNDEEYYGFTTADNHAITSLWGDA